MITIGKKLKGLIPYRIVWFPNESELRSLAAGLPPMGLARVECADADLVDAAGIVEHHLSVTLCIDLRRSPAEILAGFDSTARKRVRQAERLGGRIAIRRYNGGAENAAMLDEFVALFNKFVEHKPGAVFPISRELVESLFPHAHLFLADYDGKLTFGRLSLRDPQSGKVRHLFAGNRRFDDAESARMTAILHTYLNWHEIQVVRDAGFATLDLGGISPVDDPGINRFKLQFGAEIARHHSYLLAGLPQVWRAAFGLFTAFTDKGRRRRMVERAGDQWRGMPLDQIYQVIRDTCIPGRRPIGDRAA